jgi:hypothetical protein
MAARVLSYRRALAWIVAAKYVEDTGDVRFFAVALAFAGSISAEERKVVAHVLKHYGKGYILMKSLLRGQKRPTLRDSPEGRRFTNPALHGRLSDVAPVWTIIVERIFAFNDLEPLVDMLHAQRHFGEAELALLSFLLENLRLKKARAVSGEAPTVRLPNRSWNSPLNTQGTGKARGFRRLLRLTKRQKSLAKTWMARMEKSGVNSPTTSRVGAGLRNACESARTPLNPI